MLVLAYIGVISLAFFSIILIYGSVFFFCRFASALRDIKDLQASVREFRHAAYETGGTLSRLQREVKELKQKNEENG